MSHLTSMDKEDLHNTVVSSRIVGATTAGLRALAAQFFTFYVKVPVKLFRPTRVDYLALPRALNPIYKEKPWSFFTHSSPALLVHAVKTYGWSFVPNHILPPLLANSAVGLVLYSSYLTSLTIIEKDQQHDLISKLDVNHASKSEIQYYIKNNTSIMVNSFVAGGIAGAVQSLVAAPIDAIVTRFSASELITSQHSTMWSYGIQKLREIGPRGVFAGYLLSLTKESLGFALFFSTFETVKGPWYRTYINFFHNGDSKSANKAVYPSFILFAGALSAYAVQAVHYPLGKIQRLYLMRLETLDELAKNTIKPVDIKPSHVKTTAPEGSNFYTFFRQMINTNYSQLKWSDVKSKAFDFIVPPHSMFRLYSNAYIHTFSQIQKMVAKDPKCPSYFNWFYGGFFRATLSSLPSTSIGLVVFEIMRLRYTNPDNGLSIPTLD